VASSVFFARFFSLHRQTTPPGWTAQSGADDGHGNLEDQPQAAIEIRKASQSRFIEPPWPDSGSYPFETAIVPGS
jgi:hypothetical protein